MKTKKAKDETRFNCITNIEEVGLESFIRQYEEETGVKIELCDKCRPVVAELFLFFFLTLIESMDPGLFEEPETKDEKLSKGE